MNKHKILINIKMIFTSVWFEPIIGSILIVLSVSSLISVDFEDYNPEPGAPQSKQT